MAARTNAGRKSRARSVASDAQKAPIERAPKATSKRARTTPTKQAPKLAREQPAKAQKAKQQSEAPARPKALRKPRSEQPVAAKTARTSAKDKPKSPPRKSSPRKLSPKAAQADRLQSESALHQAESERLLAAMQRHPAPWATRQQLGLEERGPNPIVKGLLVAGHIVSVGKLGSSDAYALTRGEDAAHCLESLAARTLADLARPGQLDLLPLNGKDERYRGIPRGVLNALLARLTQRVLQRDAFPVQVGTASFVVLAEGLRALVGVAPPKGKDAGVASARRASASLDRRSVVRAYELLSRRRRSPNIIVAELQRESGVEITALQGWLLGECLAHRAVPLLGEPAHATAEQLAAALVVEGRPHLYVRLVQEQPS